VKQKRKLKLYVAQITFAQHEEDIVLKAQQKAIGGHKTNRAPI